VEAEQRREAAQDLGGQPGVQSGTGGERDLAARGVGPGVDELVDEVGRLGQREEEARERVAARVAGDEQRHARREAALARRAFDVFVV
jgi:hypothetical protein